MIKLSKDESFFMPIKCHNGTEKRLVTIIDIYTRKNDNNLPETIKWVTLSWFYGGPNNIRKQIDMKYSQFFNLVVKHCGSFVDNKKN